MVKNYKASISLELRYTVSRGRDTYGYNICTLYVNGERVSACNGGGYDMQGTSLGNWIASAYADRLLRLKSADMPAQSHWSYADKPQWLCCDMECLIDLDNPRDGLRIESTIPTGTIDRFPDVEPRCPKCGGEMRCDTQDGQRIDDGRSFYGLRFTDPNYNPGKARIGSDCSDRTLSDGAEGKTVEQAEAEGISFGLERLSAAYAQTSPHATRRHRVPSIDGACGMSSVQSIMAAIGLTMEYIPTRGKNSQQYLLHDTGRVLHAAKTK